MAQRLTMTLPMTTGSAEVRRPRAVALPVAASETRPVADEPADRTIATPVEMRRAIKAGGGKEPLVCDWPVAARVRIPRRLGSAAAVALPDAERPTALRSADRAAEAS